jgi:hypothetical protein
MVMKFPRIGGLKLSVRVTGYSLPDLYSSRQSDLSDFIGPKRVILITSKIAQGDIIMFEEHPNSAAIQHGNSPTSGCVGSP